MFHSGSDTFESAGRCALTEPEQRALEVATSSTHYHDYREPAAISFWTRLNVLPSFVHYAIAARRLQMSIGFGPVDVDGRRLCISKTPHFEEIISFLCAKHNLGLYQHLFLSECSLIFCIVLWQRGSCLFPTLLNIPNCRHV